MRICRVCTVRNKVKRNSKWTALGPCPLCDERHALFEVLAASLEHAELLLEKKRQIDEDKEAHEAERLRGLDG